MYTSHYFRKRQRLRAWQNTIGQCWGSFLKIKSVIDIGCGNGYLLEGIKSTGARVSGFDPNYDNFKEFIPESMRNDICEGSLLSYKGAPAECSMSIEVAEHIAPEYSELLVRLVKDLSQDLIVFSAAPPGQPGTGHINCRPREYWIGLFEQQKVVYDNVLTQSLVAEMLKRQLDGKWYSRNLMLFRK